MTPFPKDKFITSVERTIRVHDLFEPGDSILVGVSGGPDSVALFHVLHALVSKYSFRLGIAHLDHGLRMTESGRDRAFVSRLADRHGIPFHVDTADVRTVAREEKRSVEEAGRRVRLAFFRDTAERFNYAKIALGHHADDNAESILMFMIRGSGPHGMSGMAPQTGPIVRPFIERTRAEVLTFLHGHGIAYRTDASNRDPRYLRNRIRHGLIPILQGSYNPNVSRSLNRLAQILQSENEWIDGLLAPELKRRTISLEENRIRLSLEDFSETHPAAIRRMLRASIQAVKGDLRRISFTHIESIRHLAEAGPDSGRLDLPDRIRVERRGPVLTISREHLPLRRAASGTTENSGGTFRYTIARPAALRIPEIGMSIELSSTEVPEPAELKDAGHRVAFFDRDAVQFPLTLRTVQPGDRFTPLGLGGTQKVHDFFVNRKVPRAERNRCPILSSGDHIIWVIGHRIDESVKVTPSTRRVLKAELFLA